MPTPPLSADTGAPAFRFAPTVGVRREIGEYRGAIAVQAKTCSAGDAVLRSSAAAVSVSSLGCTPRCRGVTNDAILRIPGFAITFGQSPPSACSATPRRHPSPSPHVNRRSYEQARP
jgi:hypothetical protein